MHANSKSTVMTLAVTLGLGLAACTGPALAQAPTMSNGMSTDAWGYPSVIRGVQDVADPLAISYPYAAPGTLHLYHWTDWTKSQIAQGSVSDVKEYIQSRVDDYMRSDIDRNNHILGITDWQLPVYPQALSYPYAAPGTLHLYHYTDWTKSQVENGSVTEATEALQRDSDMKLRDEIEKDNKILGLTEWTSEVYPMAMSYPEAAPGTLHLYHYTDWTKWNVVAGSVSEAMEQMQRDADMKRFDEIDRDNKILNRDANTWMPLGSTPMPMP